MAKKTVEIVVKTKTRLEIRASDFLLAQGLSESEAIEQDILDLENGDIDIHDLTWISWSEGTPKVKIKK